MNTTDALCTACKIVWRWKGSKVSPRVTAGECFCAAEGCGALLVRTCAGNLTNPDIRTVDAIKIGVRRA